MEKIDDKTIEHIGVLYEIKKARSGNPCKVCQFSPCKSYGRMYLTTCWKLVGDNKYLKRMK